MKDTKTQQKTFPQEVREQYGYTVNQFADRIGVSASTVDAWERGRSFPNGTNLAMLNALHAKIEQGEPESVDNLLKTPEDVKALTRRILDGYGDTVGAFARRMGVHRNNVERWLYSGHISRSGKALLLTVARHPERFVMQPKPMI